MGKLIQNERIKLYRKVSTWVLTGIVIALNLFMLLVTKFSMSSFMEYTGYQADWNEQYTSIIRDMKQICEGDPNETGAYYTAQWLQYLKDRQIPPEDWRTDVAWEYYYWQEEAKREQADDEVYYNSFADYSYYGQTPTLPTLNSPEDRQTRIDQLGRLLESSDWRTYLQQQIAFLDSGAITMMEDEKTVSREIYQMYLDMEIEPISLSMSSFMETDGGGIWKNSQMNLLKQYKLNVLRGEDDNGNILTRSQKVRLEKEIEVSLERLRTNTKPLDSMWEGDSPFASLMDQSVSFVYLLTMVMIVTAGGMIATEFSSGTVKLLLITPHRRKKIFWAKALILLELTLIEIVALFLISFLFSGLLTGFEGLGAGQVLYIFGAARHMPYLLYIAYKYLLQMIPVLVYAALALMLSAVTRRSAVAIAVSLVLMYAGEIIVSIVAALSAAMGFELPGLEFLLFSNVDLTNYLSGSSSLMGMMSATGTTAGVTSLGFSLAVLLAYFVCFLWIARDSFCRRDVK